MLATAPWKVKGQLAGQGVDLSRRSVPVEGESECAGMWWPFKKREEKEQERQRDRRRRSDEVIASLAQAD